MKIDRLIGIITTLQQKGKVTAPYLADKFEDTYRHQYQYYKKFKEDVERFILDNYSFPTYQHNDIEVASYDIAYNMTEILEERTGR